MIQTQFVPDSLLWAQSVTQPLCQTLRGLDQHETGCVARFDAPGQPNVAWISSLEVPGAVSSLTVFSGPLTDVPHLLSRAVPPLLLFLWRFLFWRCRGV